MCECHRPCCIISIKVTGTNKVTGTTKITSTIKQSKSRNHYYHIVVISIKLKSQCHTIVISGKVTVLPAGNILSPYPSQYHSESLLHCLLSICLHFSAVMTRTHYIYVYVHGINIHRQVHKITRKLLCDFKLTLTTCHA